MSSCMSKKITEVPFVESENIYYVQLLLLLRITYSEVCNHRSEGIQDKRVKRSKDEKKDSEALLDFYFKKASG